MFWQALHRLFVAPPAQFSIGHVRAERAEIRRLQDAIARNGREECRLLMDPRTTTFRGETEFDTDEAVLSTIRSVPTHY